MLACFLDCIAFVCICFAVFALCVLLCFALPCFALLCLLACLLVCVRAFCLLSSSSFSWRRENQGSFTTQVGNAACVCLQEVNPVWAKFIREIAPRCAATPAIECFSMHNLMMIWRTDVLNLRGDVEVCPQFPSPDDDSSPKRNWRVYLKARVATANLIFVLLP